MVDALIARFGDSVTGQWRVPGEFGKAVNVTKQNTMLFVSDRDMLVFLADEENRIETPNRRTGKFGSFARGLFVIRHTKGAPDRWLEEVTPNICKLAGLLRNTSRSTMAYFGKARYGRSRSIPFGREFLAASLARYGGSDE